MSRKPVAIMQPYLYPYLGYLGLMAHADEFVVLACVQFPRRGRVHRSQVPGPNGTERWLTLPLARAPRSTRICDLQFGADAHRRWHARLAMHTWMRGAAPSDLTETLMDALAIKGPSVCDYLVSQLHVLRDAFGLRCVITRSSELGIDPALRGAERLVAVARARGAERYVNAPGGRALYAAEQFAPHGLELGFLPPYPGPYRHVLPALMRGERDRMAADLARYAAQPLVTAGGVHA